jgi:hypothetical protein
LYIYKKVRRKEKKMKKMKIERVKNKLKKITFRRDKKNGP